MRPTRGSDLRRVLMGVLFLLVAGVAAAASGATSSSSREALHASPLPLKVAKLDSHLAALQGRTVRVELLASRPAGARALVAREGGRVEASYGRLVEALVPVESLNTLARNRTVRFVREPAQPVPEAVRGEGVVSTGAASWHRAGTRGEGVKIAVIDLGFDGYRHSQATGDLPAAVGKAADYARSHGIQIISHSVSWLNTRRGDGAGPAASPEGIVAAARSAGILWVNAAGNRAEQHWSGTFADSNGNGWDEFEPGDEGNTISVPAGAYACAALKWDDWPASAEDYDLYLIRSPGG